ncbi:MAG TPA: histidine kinase [Bacteroidia bacterium]|nr:histidine kinase [Bacteroidia bacterium]
MRILFIYFLIFLFQNIFAQNVSFPFYHYESENGLIHLNVLSIKQNKNYILYAVTQGGVYEFAGQSFQKKQEFSSLKNIRNIFFNDTTTFLVHRDLGLFYFSKNKVKPFFNNNPFKRPSDEIYLLNNFCYNYTEQISLEFYDYIHKVYYNDSILLSDNSNFALCVNQINNKLLVGRRKGLYVVENNKVKLLPAFKKIPVYSIFHRKDKHLLYLGSNQKIYICDDSLFRIKYTIPVNVPVSKSSNLVLFNLEKNISKLLVDKYDRIWFCTQPDDNLYLVENEKVYDVFEFLNILPVLINDIYLDNFNNVWISTFNDGIYQINSTFWQSFRISAFEKYLSVHNIESLSSNLFFATNNGLYFSDTTQPNFIQPIINADNFFNKEIFSIINYNNKIYASEYTAFEHVSIKQNNTSINIFPFKYLAIKNNQEIIVSDITNNALKFNLNKNKITDTIFKPTDFRLTIKHLFCYDKKIYISTNKGLFIYDETQKQIITKIEDNDVRKVVLIDNQLYALYENKIYNLDQEKIFFDAEKWNIITITDFEKFNEYFFVSSEEGLLIIDKNLNIINFLGRKNGLISNVINDILISNNILYVATDKGVSYTNIQNLLNFNLLINTPVITSIYTNNDTFNLSISQSLVFNKNTQDIYFNIVCPNFNPLTKITYQYSLNNSEWIDFENTPLHFSSIAGGDYILQIRATTDKIHFTPPFQISFKKELSFSEEKWFWELIIILGILIILIISYIIRKIEKKKTEERLKIIQQMNLLKHQAMNAILSPHFIFNSLTGIQNYILKNDVDKASDYLSKFSRLIRMIIERASSPTITLTDEIKRLQFYLELEKERFQDKFDFEIIIDDNVDVNNIELPNMIIQPYLENAILHGILPKKDKGHLSVSFSIKNEDKKFLEILIEDDGIGIIKGEEKKPKHHKSLATKTIAEILNINSQLYGKYQSVQIIDKSTIQPNLSGTIVKILIEL